MWNIYAFVFIMLAVAQVFAGLNWHREYKKRSDKIFSFALTDARDEWFGVKNTEIFHVTYDGKFEWGASVDDKQKAARTFAIWVNEELNKSKEAK